MSHKEFGGRYHADGLEHAIDFQGALLAGLRVLHLQTRHLLDEPFLLAGDLHGHVAPHDLDVRSRQHALLQRGGAPELVAAVHDIDFRAELRQVEGVLQRGVAAADDHGGLVAEEVAVAGGASGDPEATELVLAGQMQPTRARTRGHDDRLGDNLFTVIQLAVERTTAEIDFLHHFGLHLHAELQRLFAQLVHDDGTARAAREAGEVLHFVGDGQLTALLHSLNEEGFQVGTCRIYACHVARRTGSDNEAFYVSCHIFLNFNVLQSLFG